MNKQETERLQRLALSILVEYSRGSRKEVSKTLSEKKLWNGRLGSTLMERYLSRCHLPSTPDQSEKFEKTKDVLLEQSKDFPSLADFDRIRARTMEQNGVLYGMMRFARIHGIDIITVPDSLKPYFEPTPETLRELEIMALGMLRTFVAHEREGSELDWTKPLYQTIGHMEEASAESAQILMKKYQERLVTNNAIYPELRWPDLRLTIAEHMSEWGNAENA